MTMSLKKLAVVSMNEAYEWVLPRRTRSNSWCWMIEIRKLLILVIKTQLEL